MRGFRLIFITTVIAAVAALLIIGGCTQQPEQPAKTESPQLPAQQPSLPPQQAPATEANAQQQPQQSAATQDDLYKDNLDGALDDLSQLE